MVFLLINFIIQIFFVFLGRSCGIDLPDYPYIYFATPTKGYLNRTTCVKKCPVYANETMRETLNLDCVPNKIVQSCIRSDVEIDSVFTFATQTSEFLNSSVFIYNTTGRKFFIIYYLNFNIWKVFGRICFPSSDFFLDKMEGLASELDIDNLEEWFSDIKTSWPIILASAGIAIVIG